MKILLVTKLYYPTIGGIQRAVAQLAAALQSMDHQAEVLTLNRAKGVDKWPDDEVVVGVPVKRIPYVGSLRYPLAQLPLAMLRQYDCINVHSSDSLLDGLVWTAWRHQRPLVLTSHGLFFHTPYAQQLKRVYFRTMTRLSLRRVQGIICDSEQDLAALSTITDPQKLQLIPNGVPVEQLARYQIAGRDHNLLLAVGQLTERKRPDLLLPVLAELVRQRPLMRLLFIGPDKDGLQTSLSKKIARLGLQAHVVFTGPVSDTDLYDYLGRGAVWLSASAYEGFGIALAEAMAAGCVPLVSPLHPFRQILGADADALTTTFADPVLVADRILAILNLTDAARTAVTIRLRQQVADYSWTAVAKKNLKVYETAILANN